MTSTERERMHLERLCEAELAAAAATSLASERIEHLDRAAAFATEAEKVGRYGSMRDGLDPEHE